MDWITDNIALGSCMDVYKIRDHVDLILNMAAEVPPEYRKPTLHLQIYDGHAIGESILDEAMAYLTRAELDNKKVFVHCIAGISRSPSIVATYLALKENITFAEAIAKVKLKRVQVDPNYSWQVYKSCKEYVERKQQ